MLLIKIYFSLTLRQEKNSIYKASPQKKIRIYSSKRILLLREKSIQIKKNSRNATIVNQERELFAAREFVQQRRTKLANGLLGTNRPILRLHARTVVLSISAHKVSIAEKRQQS